MDTKKLTLKKQLMAAVAMVLVALLAIGTATFAWFTNSQEVKAENLKVKAATPGSFLMIYSPEKDENYDEGTTVVNADYIQANGDTSVDFAMSSATYNPVAHNVISGTTDALKIGTSDEIWYTSKASLPSAATSDGTKTYITSFDSNVIHKTVYLTVADSAEAISELQCSATVTAGESKTIDHVNVLLTTNSTAEDLHGADGEDPASYTTATSLGGVSDSTFVKVDIFIYINGDHSAVYTNNYPNLDEATISLKFEPAA